MFNLVQFDQCVFIYIVTVDIAVKIIEEYPHILYIQVPNLSTSCSTELFQVDRCKSSLKIIRYSLKHS